MGKKGAPENTQKGKNYQKGGALCATRGLWKQKQRRGGNGRKFRERGIELYIRKKKIHSIEAFERPT